MTVTPPAARKPGPRAAAILAACALCAPLVVGFEGWVKKAAPDPIGIPTACAGHTAGVTSGRDYTDDECLTFLNQDLVQHGTAIDACIKVEIPVRTRAAFTSFAFNVGAANFCASTLDRKLNAGDRAGACAELSKWVYAGGKVFPGLVKRRATERAWCEAGLRGE